MTNHDSSAVARPAVAAQLRGVTKAFAGVVAVKHIDLELQVGRVLAILGENGAGKSTLMKILSGVYEPTEGTIVVGDQEFSHLTPARARDLGISIIYQELSVINQLSIAENIFLGNLPKKGGLVDWRGLFAKAQALLDQYGIRRDASDYVSDLSVSEKQMVEVMKATASNARVIVMDEPTTSLTESEIEVLFDLVRQLQQEGRAIAFISHKMKEIFDIADDVLVLRDGAVSLEAEIGDVDADTLVRAMVGRELDGRLERPPYQGDNEGETLLSVRELCRKDGKVQDIQFDLRAGEILAFSGLVGAGRSELVEAIYGASKRSVGSIEVFGRNVSVRNTYDGLNAGMSLVSEDRRGSGIFKNFDITTNISLANGLKRSRFGGLLGWTNHKRDTLEAAQFQEELRIKCRDLSQSITELSGGNQQKVLIARALNAKSRIIIFDEPTKGIDVGAKAEIYRLLRKLCSEGVGILVISSDLPEILTVSDRVIVMRDGRIVGERVTATTTEEELVSLATGHIEEVGAA
ncbi:sugar ABC transporter ATP-binding protein [Tessaracoccus sp. Y36]